MKRETERLKEVYRGYRQNKRVQEKWRYDSEGNQFISTRRAAVMANILRDKHYLPLHGRRILDIGCGNGRVLANFLDWGAQADNLYGVDLINERIEEGKKLYPALALRCVNAEKLDFPDNFFDLILVFTVFSSILDEAMARTIAKEATRILKAGGLILLYDVRYSNPFNPHTRRIGKKNIEHYFKECSFERISLTLIPQLARFCAHLSYTLCVFLEKIPFLRSHYFVIIEKI